MSKVHFANTRILQTVLLTSNAFLFNPTPLPAQKNNNKINWALLCSNGTSDVEGFSKDFERAL